MGIFSDLGQLGTIALSAWNPAAGLIGGTLIGREAALEQNRASSAQRKKEMAAKAALAASDWARKNPIAQTMEVSPYESPEAAAMLGSASGLSQALKAHDVTKGSGGIFSLLGGKKAATAMDVNPNVATSDVSGFVEDAGQLNPEDALELTKQLRKRSYAGAGERSVPTLFGLFNQG